MSTPTERAREVAERIERSRASVWLDENVKTTAELLLSYRKEVLEEAAQVATQHRFACQPNSPSFAISNAVRALKEAQ